MGFGLLLFGYFLAFSFAFSLSDLCFIVGIIGTPIMMFAFVKLSEYNLYFKTALWSAFAYLAACGLELSAMLLHFYDMSGTVGMIVSVVMAVAACGTHILMFLGARSISLGAGDNALAAKCERQLVMSAIYYIFYITALTLGRFLGELVSYISMVLLVYWLCCYILNMIVIYKCFGSLYSAEEDFSKPRRSKIGLVNKLNDKFDEFDSKSDSFRRESIKMANDEADRRVREKQNNPKKKKKKK